MSSAPQAQRGWRRFLEDSSLIRHYLWKYRRWVAIGLGSLVVVDILEILPPLILKESVDSVVERRPLSFLGWMAAAYLATSLIQGVCRYGWRMYLVRTSMFAGRDLRQRFTGHLFGLSASFFDRKPVGDLMSLATNDAEAVRMAIGAGVITLADALCYFLTVPVAMFLLSPQMTVLAFIPLLLVPPFVLWREKQIHVRFTRVQESFSKLAAMAQEGLSGIRVIKSFAREDAQAARFREASREYYRLSMRLARVQSSFGPTLDFIMSLGLVLLLWVGGSQVITDAVTLGTFVAFQRYIQKMVWPMMAVGMAVTFYQRAVASSGRLKNVLAVTTDTPEPEKGPTSVPAPFPREQRGRIELRKLSFAYSGPSRLILKDLTLTIEPGEKIALVGPIGSGKTALLSLIPRLYPVARGMLVIDGLDVNDWPLDELRNQIGFVAQDPFLFSQSVWENVALGMTSRASAAQSPTGPVVHEAIRLAALERDVQNLPDGGRTRLGERGVTLSGGQKQRLTLARALIRNPRILILDDAVSSVDVQTEAAILKALESRPDRGTELAAAHRVSTIQNADRILVLQEGKIVQQGNHRKLLQDRSGFYFKLHERQKMEAELKSWLTDYEEGIRV